MFVEKSTKVTLAAFSVSTTACVNSWMNSVLRELTGALFMLTVAMPLASVSTETWAKPVEEELKLAEGRAKLRLRLKVNLLQLREDMLSSLEEYTPCWNRNLIAPKDPFAPLWILIEEPHSM